MATIPLKDITFPGLDNTYTIPEIDNTLSIAGKAADAKEVGDALADVDDKFTEVDKDLSQIHTEGTVPTSEQMLSDNYSVDSVPYHFRKTASDNADREELEIVGGSVAWNQLAKALSSATTIYGITINGNASENSLTLAGTATDSRYLSIPSNVFGATPPPNHVLLMHGYKEAGTYNGNMFLFGNSNNMFTLSAPTIKKPSVIENTQLYVQIENGVEYNFKLRINIFDLTAMFGSTIADYIYSLEQATAGAGVAMFRSLFNKDYYPFDAGSMQSVSGLSAHNTYDADDNLIRSYPLNPNGDLRGYPMLVDGKIKWNGDIYPPSGKVNRRYGVVDLGTLNWGYSQVGTMNMFNAPFSPIKTTGYNNSSIFPLVCPKYSAVAFYASGVYMGNSDKSIAYAPSGGNRFYITDSSYTSADDFKSAMSGVYLVYELATPTTETAEPYINPQICDPNGTEEFVSTGIVPVGHETRYPENLRAKIEGLPWDFSLLIAPTEKTTTASRNYTAGSLLIMGNVLYKVTANIANGGTITPNTNVTATTLAEIIAALS